VSGAPGRAWLVCAVFVGLVMTAMAPVEASVTIQSFRLEPSSPTTGDPVVLTAVIQSTSSCNFIDAGILFGPLPELGGQRGWAITIDFQEGALPVVSTCPIEKDLGGLQVASAEGVLRARNDGIVNDTRTFTLNVAPGPAAGWEDPSLHEEFFLETLSSAATMLPGRLVMSDNVSRRLLMLDPETGLPISTIPSPGSGNVRGLASDGLFLFASVREATAPRIYKIDLLGRVLDSFPSPVISPGSAPLEGLAFRNGILYGTYATPPRLFAMNPITHQKLWDRPLPGAILALDAAPEGLLGAESTGEFFLIEPDPTGNDLLLADSVDTGVSPTPSFTGLAYDGHRVLAFDQNSLQMMSMRTLAVWWALDGTLRAYVPPPDQAVDVIQGDLDNMLQLSGYFDLSFFGPATCLASHSLGGVVPDPDNPPPGHAFFYMARFIDASGSTGYYGRNSLGFRRFDSSEACP
jgi:hypothetical protein